MVSVMERPGRRAVCLFRSESGCERGAEAGSEDLAEEAVEGGEEGDGAVCGGEGESG